MKVSGGCHCGAVRFTAEVEREVSLLDCNCSICAMHGYLHLIVPQDSFVLEQGADATRAYRFGTGAAEHLFCQTCGVKSYYSPRSHPGSFSVNYRCLDAGHGLSATKIPFDGQNWEESREALKG